MGLSVSKSGSKGSKAYFTKAAGGTSIKTGNNGSTRVGVTGCNSKRAASNVKVGYSSAKGGGYK